MATTVSKTTFTSKITESITLNNHPKKLETTLTISDVTDYSHRIMSVSTGTSSIILLGASDNAGTLDRERFKYLRITKVLLKPWLGLMILKDIIYLALYLMVFLQIKR